MGLALSSNGDSGNSENKRNVRFASSLNHLIGGPLMKYNTDDDKAYWYLAGIVSFGSKDCGAFRVPGVYTRVSSFLQWIEKNIE